MKSRWAKKTSGISFMSIDKRTKPLEKNNLVPYHRFVTQFAQMRAGTRLREIRAQLMTKDGPRQIIFLHLPKTGGSTVRSYLEACIGSFRSRHAARIWEYDPNKPLTEEAIVEARKCRFVSGHFSWQAMKKVRKHPSAFTFTMLREPVERMKSLCLYMRNHPVNKIPRDMYDVFVAAAQQPLDVYLRSEDPRFHHIFNNFTVRAVSGDMSVPTDDAQWRVRLEQAKQNLADLDYVGFSRTLEAELQKILAQCNVPYVAPIRRQNETKYLIEKRRDGSDETHVFTDDVMRSVERLSVYDCELFVFAETLADRRRH